MDTAGPRLDTATVHADPGTPAPTRGRAPSELLRALRPLQWSKNLLVFVAPGAAGSLVHIRTVLDALGAFGIFCAAASATYLVNDVVDAQADRLHPEKRRRPVASGTVRPALAVVSALALAAAALGGAAALAGWQLVTATAAYLAVTVVYSLWLKREPVLELVAVASGFVIRAIGGGLATGVHLSRWFLVVTSFGALLLVVGKRAAERAAMGEEGSSHRRVLAHYTPTFLRSAMTLCASGAVTTYCLWAFDKTGLAARGRLVPVELSVVPVVTGVLYVLRLLDLGRGGAPTEFVLRDRMLWALGLVWALLVGIGVYA